DRIEHVRRNAVAGEAGGTAGRRAARAGRERVLDEERRAVSLEAGEISRELGGRRHEERALLGVIVDVLFPREQEERMVLDDRPAAAAAAVAPVLGHVGLTQELR